MSDLIILTSTDPSAAWDWGLPETGQIGHAATSDEKTVLAGKSFSRVVVVVPGTEVVTKLHTLEGLKEKQKIQAAGFSIEDELAASLDDTHIAFDPNGSRMAICSNDVMVNVGAALGTYGLNPDIICADYDSYADEASVEYQGRIISRAGSGLGFAVETGLASAVLDKDQGVPSTITTQGLLEKIAQSLIAGHKPINLRQGRFVNKSSMGSGSFKRLSLLAAGVAAAFLALNIPRYSPTHPSRPIRPKTSTAPPARSARLTRLILSACRRCWPKASRMWRASRFHPCVMTKQKANSTSRSCMAVSKIRKNLKQPCSAMVVCLPKVAHDKAVKVCPAMPS